MILFFFYIILISFAGYISQQCKWHRKDQLSSLFYFAKLRKNLVLVNTVALAKADMF